MEGSLGGVVQPALHLPAAARTKKTKTKKTKKTKKSWKKPWKKPWKT